MTITFRNFGNPVRKGIDLAIKEMQSEGLINGETTIADISAYAVQHILIIEKSSNDSTLTTKTFS